MRLEKNSASIKVETPTYKCDASTLKSEAPMKAQKTSTTPVEENEASIEKDPIENFIEFTDKVVTLSDIEAVWRDFILTVTKEKKGLIPVLHGSRPSEIHNNRIKVVILPDSKMFMNLLSNPGNSEYLNGLISRLVKKLLVLEYDVLELIEDDVLDKEAQIKNYFKAYQNVLEIK